MRAYESGCGYSIKNFYPLKLFGGLIRIINEGDRRECRMEKFFKWLAQMEYDKTSI